MEGDWEKVALILVIGALLYASCEGKWAVYGDCVRREMSTEKCKELRP